MSQLWFFRINITIIIIWKINRIIPNNSILHSHVLKIWIIVMRWFGLKAENNEPKVKKGNQNFFLKCSIDMKLGHKSSLNSSI